jgi:hypothetical protein
MKTIPYLLKKNIFIVIVGSLEFYYKAQVSTIPVWSKSIPGAINKIDC